ncbi:MAG TPA: transposase [Dehalococcoidia bacterium]|nr:transposase [Dehalococcoidia bacterium]
MVDLRHSYRANRSPSGAPPNRVGFIETNLSYPPSGIVRFYNGLATVEQWIEGGKQALNWTRLSCHKFVANQVRL